MTPCPFIASVDPGLDETAIVRFDLRRWEPTSNFATAGRALEPDYAVLTTEPGMLLADRLLLLAQGIEAACADGGAGMVYLELPSLAGGGYHAMRTRGGVTRNSAEVGKLHMAIGALLCGIRRAGVMVVPFPAPHINKDKKRDAVRQIVTALGMPDWAKGPRGGEKQDVLDAAFNGLWVLTEPGLRPARWVGRP